MYRSWRKQLGYMIVVAIAVVSLVPAVQAASAPNIITYQGRVLNANGVPVSDSSLSMSFAFYTASSGGTCVWSNSSDTCASVTAQSVTLGTGLFTVNLGGTGYASIGDSVFADNGTLYLEVIIAGETLTPRRQITAAPYALNSDTLDGIDSGSFLRDTGDTATGSYNLTGAVLSGSSPLVFEGSTDDDVETIFTVTNATTTDKTITFQNASGTVAFLSDVGGGGLWESGTFVYEDDSAVVVGTDVAFTYGSGGVGDLRVADQLEVLGDGFIDNDLIVGASTSSTETITNASFTLGGDDLFVAGDAGIEGTLYLDGGINAVGTVTVGDLSCTDCLDFTELADSLTLDTSTSIAVTGTNTFTITNSGSSNVSIALTSTGEFHLSDSVGEFAAFTGIGSSIFTLDSTSNPVFGIANNGTNEILFNLAGTGDFNIKDNNVTFMTVSDTGGYSFSLDATDNPTYVITNSGSGNVQTTLLGTGDFVILDGVNTAFSVNDSSTTTISQTTTNDGLFLNQDGNGIAFNIDSESTSVDVINIDAETLTGTVIDLNATNLSTGKALDITATNTAGSNTAVDQILFTLTNAQAVAANSDFAGIEVSFTNNPSVLGNTERAMRITNAVTANITDNAVASLLTIDNADTDSTGSTVVTDGIAITVSGGLASGIVDAIDASATTIDNALNAGTNFIVLDGLRVFASDSILTWEDFIGNDMMTLTDNGSTGILNVTGDITCADCLDFSDFTDSMSLDASSSIAMDGSETFTITNGGIGNVIFNLSSTGDFVIQDNSTPVFTVDDGGTVTIAQTSTSNALFINQDGNGVSLNIDSEATSANVVTLDGSAITTGNVLDITYTGTTGSAISVTDSTAADGNAMIRLYNTATDVTAQTYLIQGIYADTADPEADFLLFQDANGAAQFSVDQDGVTTITGNGDSTNSLILTTGDILVSNGDLDGSGGDFNWTLDAGDGVDITKAAAPTVDVFTINAGTSATDNVDALRIVSNVAGATGTAFNIDPNFTTGVADDYSVISIDAFAATTTANVASNVKGVNVGNLTETENTLNNITSVGVDIGTGWDVGLSLGSDLQLDDDVNLTFGTGSDARMTWETSDADAHYLNLNVGPSRNFIISEDANIDWTHATATNPTLWIQSADSATVADYISLAHDQTDAQLVVGAGDLVFTVAGGDLQLSTIAINGTDYDITADGLVTLAPDSGGADGIIIDINDTTGAAITDAIDVSDTSFVNALNVGANAIIGSTGIINYDNFDVDATGIVTGSDFICTDCLDFSDFTDSMSLDASSSIAMDGSETFTITNGGIGNVIFNLSSTGDFVIQDNSTPVFTVDDGGTVTIAQTSTSNALFINQDGNGVSLNIDSEATSANVVTLDGSAITTGNILSIVGGNFTDDSGQALVIDVTESTATSNIITIQTDFGSLNNNVFSIEADGEVFSDIGFTAGAFSTNYLDGEIQTTGDILLDIDGGDLTFDQETIIGDGGDALTVNSSGTLTVDDATIAGTGALTIRSTSSGFLRLDSGSGLVFTHTGDDFSVGVNSLTSAFSVDESSNLVRIGDGADTNGAISMYANGSATGTIEYNNDDYWDFQGGAMYISSGKTFTDPLSVSGMVVVEAETTRVGVLSVNSSTYTGSFHMGINSNNLSYTHNARAIGGFAELVSESLTGPSELTGVYGHARVYSLSQTSPDIAGVRGAAESTISGGTATSAYGVHGSIVTGSGTVTTGYGGSFTNTASGTNRYGLIASASGGTTNFSGYFHSSRVQIDDDATPNTPGVATGAGDLYVVDAIELDGNLNAAGSLTATFGTGGSYTSALCWDNSGASEIQDCVGAVSADYAEQYPVEAGVEYGDIVVPGSDEVKTTQGDTIAQLIKSSRPYEGPIVGIVSNNYSDFTSAGYNIEQEDNPMPVALVGRVPVKVTLEGGAISAGDYLTTSSTPGAAMKATKVGRVIGMALQDWDGVSTTVMVQVNNSWSMGDILGTDGVSTLVTDNVVVSALSTATREQPTFGSYGLALRGSAWNGSEAEAVNMMLQNVVDTHDEYRLSVRNTTETEVAYITNEGTMKIAGDMVIGGHLYPSDRGTPQTEKYIYYDGSTGVGGDFMRTNAKGWSTGSYDFAEMLPSNEELTSGDVVVFAGTGETVQRATGVDGEQLAGIVSTRPGFLAGENVAGAYPIALAGRVPTKVSTANGAITVGDPLTASITAGVAMKAGEAGQIIGYALENYTGSESDNLILVYVNVGYWSGGPQTITIVQNQASQVSSDAREFSALNMSGNIYMTTNQILSIGRLEGVSGIWSIESDGTIKTKGSFKTVTESYQGTDVETVAVTSPESVITLTGTATLSGGRAEVRFEDVVTEYNDIISAIAPIRVIVTPSGPVSLYVSEKDQNHFVVERFVGSADVEFDWMVTGYRKGFEPEEEEPPVAEAMAGEEEVAPDFSLGESEQAQVPSDLSESDLSEPVIEEPISEEEPVVLEEPATPESPDTTQVDSATQDDGGQAAEPSDVVIETLSTQEP